MIDTDRMTEAQRSQLAACGIIPGHKKQPQRGRYGNVAQPTIYQGVRYDSKGEANHAAGLDVRLRAGDIAWWLRQVTVPLGPDFKSRVDFLVAQRVVMSSGRLFNIMNQSQDAIFVHAEEFKGKETPEFRKVRKLWPKYAPFPLWIFKARGETEIIEGRL